MSVWRGLQPGEGPGPVGPGSWVGPRAADGQPPCANTGKSDRSRGVLTKREERRRGLRAAQEG